MRLSHLLFLAVGIAVGLAIGTTVGRHRRHAPRATRAADQAKTKRQPVPQAERSAPEPWSTPVRVRPADTSSESAALPEGMGILELLWEGAPEGNEAWLAGTDLVGERETIDLDPKDLAGHHPTRLDHQRGFRRFAETGSLPDPRRPRPSRLHGV